MKDTEHLAKSIQRISRLVRMILILCGSALMMMIYYLVDPNLSLLAEREDQVAIQPADPDVIVDGIHVRTGLVDAEGLMDVVTNCTNCHSAKLVIQNRMDSVRWIETIRWMQQTQNLWDLGEKEEIIVNYLITNYPAQKTGRRMSLSAIEWYPLEE